MKTGRGRKKQPLYLDQSPLARMIAEGSVWNARRRFVNNPEGSFGPEKESKAKSAAPKGVIAWLKEGWRKMGSLG